jgi:hypothetical protein
MAERTIPEKLRHGQISPIHIEGGLVFVALSRGLEAVADIDDEQIIAGYSWRVLTTKYGHAYAYRLCEGRTILMHREILGAGPGEHVDHIDGDGLNNRRENIRIATPTQNQANQVLSRRNRIGLKGVWEDKRKNRFCASIKPNGKTIHLGSFATKEEAAAAYKGAAKVLWGDFAKQ